VATVKALGLLYNFEVYRKINNFASYSAGFWRRSDSDESQEYLVELNR